MYYLTIRTNMYIILVVKIINVFETSNIFIPFIYLYTKSIKTLQLNISFARLKAFKFCSHSFFELIYMTV